jgi:negative regulator of sigma E activity
MQDKHEAAIDKTLSALRNASPPEGMEARIQQRLRYQTVHADAAVSGFWRPTRAWWTGVLTGAAVATLVCFAVLLGLRSRTDTVPPNIASSTSRTAPIAVSMHPAEPSSTRPCATATGKRESAHRSQRQFVRTATEAPKPSTRQFPDELTPQERELVRLVHVADPKQLSEMSSEARAAADQQESAAFKKFFTPPPPPPHDEGVNE